MNTVSTVNNWIVRPDARVLEQIHHEAINISIWDRDISPLTQAIDLLLQQDMELRAKGEVSTILDCLAHALQPSECAPIYRDIDNLLQRFRELSGAKIFRLLLATVSTNMCRRFHTDINDLRMLCTYRGAGTLWLTEDNVNRDALGSCGDAECIVIDERQIRQAKTGSVVLLKGAIYPQEGVKAVVHRSPPIEASGEKRLLLRIDTNEFLNFDV